METELTALTEENNAKFIELSKIIDELKEEKDKMYDIMHDQIATSGSDDSSLNPHYQQNIAYLLHEVEANAVDFADTLV